MSAATDRIAYYWLGKGDSTFLTAGEDFAAEDQPLIDAGVFNLVSEEQESILCPFGCGEMEPIHLLPRRNGKGMGHYVICRRGNGETELQPRDYQLYAFDPSALLRYNKGLNSAVKEQRKRKSVRPRKTSWVEAERKAVLAYANNPKRNTSGKLPHEICEHVWNLNREDFEAAATLPIRQRGYKNAHSLRAYFYRQYAETQRRKTVCNTV